LGSVRKQPSMTDVIVLACGFSTPRITMHKWLHARGRGVDKGVSASVLGWRYGVGRGNRKCRPHHIT
jgi:hypothetical protein